MLGDQSFPLNWQETSMSDGKPLEVSIGEEAGTLSLRFDKADDGLLAEGPGVICKEGQNLETEISGNDIRLGPAANWLVRHALGNGAEFKLTMLGPSQLRIETSGWDGVFSPKPPSTVN